MFERFCAFLFIFLSLTSPQKAERSAAAAESVSAPIVKVGEQLTYSVKWNDVKAAKVIMSSDQIKDEKFGDAYRVEVKVDTIGVARDIITVNDKFAALLDPKTMLPFRADKEILEGPKSENRSTVFDQEKHLAAVGEEKAVSIEPKTHDIASIFWAIRGLELKEGSTATIPVFNSAQKKMFAVNVEVGKAEELETSAGAFKAVQLTIKMIEQKNADDKYQIRMWVTDDERRMPVLVTALPPFGKVKMELVDTGGSNEAKPSSPESNPTSEK